MISVSEAKAIEKEYQSLFDELEIMVADWFGYNDMYFSAGMNNDDKYDAQSVLYKAISDTEYEMDVRGDLRVRTKDANGFDMPTQGELKVVAVMYDDGSVTNASDAQGMVEDGYWIQEIKYSYKLGKIELGNIELEPEIVLEKMRYFAEMQASKAHRVAAKQLKHITE